MNGQKTSRGSIAEHSLTKDDLAQALGTRAFTVGRPRAEGPFHGRVLTFPEPLVLSVLPYLYLEPLSRTEVLVIATRPGKGIPL